ncbi:MAG: sulfotransferase [Pyrinomonadaceae bacterium]
MSVGTRGENLIFVISQPRAGSTMLQRMLGGHEGIHTVSEPWLMLHPLYALRAEGHEAEYDAANARRAVREFLGTLPRGEEEYIEGVRRMCAHLYDVALQNSGKRYFLDKTPRYYLIIPELVRAFPEARYIILLRNPLSMLGSVLNTWIKGQWSSLYSFRHDLIEAPRLLVEGRGVLPEDGLVVRYEELVTKPEDEMRRICRMLGEEFTPEMVEYNARELPRWTFGDQGGVYQHTRPVAGNAQKWIAALHDPQVWRLTHDYLRLLGRELVGQMGYDYDELEQTVEKERPNRARLWPTLPLAWFLKEPVEKRRKWQRGVARLAHSLRRRGSKGVEDETRRKASLAAESQ